MENMIMQVVGNTLTITVDLSKRFGRSTSGKTILIASSDGAMKLSAPHRHVGVSLSIFTKEGMDKL